ncbi:helix-turn-helix domain-containing protein [Desulfovirgula thermocuniculi]|uniref:helix-turn-helix domain-containing protein n=1 Tax=Desulfovirgula thermocuniculi TaxID=348842 RepID=UPI000A04FAED|nr:helix-turn-helix transcriptional regulator [Desulfovirgula thermocuniculi]
MKAAEFGRYLQHLRKKRGLTIRQVELASGVSNSYLSQIENGKRGIPSPEILKKLAPVLHVSYKELMVKAGYLDDYDQTGVEEKGDIGTLAAHRTDDPLKELPEEARRSLEEFQEYILRKYGKKKD